MTFRAAANERAALRVTPRLFGQKTPMRRVIAFLNPPRSHCLAPRCGYLVVVAAVKLKPVDTQGNTHETPRRLWVLVWKLRWQKVNLRHCLLSHCLVLYFAIT